MALENVSESEFIDKSDLVLPAIFIAAIWFFLVFAVFKSESRNTIRPLGRWKIAGAVITIILFMGMFHARSKEGSLVTLNPDLAPLTSLARKFEVLYNRKAESVTASADLVTMISKLKVLGLDANKKFPLVKSFCLYLRFTL